MAENIKYHFSKTKIQRNQSMSFFSRLYKIFEESSKNLRSFVFRNFIRNLRRIFEESSKILHFTRLCCLLFYSSRGFFHCFYMHIYAFLYGFEISVIQIFEESSKFLRRFVLPLKILRRFVLWFNQGVLWLVVLRLGT